MALSRTGGPCRNQTLLAWLWRVPTKPFNRLAQRNKVAPILTMGCCDFYTCGFLELGNLAAKAVEFNFEFQHSFYAGEVEPVVCEFLNSSQRRDISLAVSTATPVGSSWRK